MAIMARLYRDMRVSVRHEVALDATLRDPERRPFDVVIEELSVTGVRIPDVVELTPGAVVTLGIAGIGMCDIRVVRRDERGYACAFLFPLGAEELDDAVAATPQAPIPLATHAVPPLPAPPAEAAYLNALRLPVATRLALLLAFPAATWGALIFLFGAR